MLRNGLAVVNSKGGVGKTSIVANLAGTAAAGGWRTLAVDLDSQGNLARDLGYWHDSDNGAALSRALLDGADVAPRRAVRSYLDVLPGGAALADISDAARLSGMDLATPLHRVLHRLSDQYNLVVLDCPPAAGPIQRAALGVAAFALIPTKADDASIDGLEGLATEIAAVRESLNPELQVIGVVLFDLGAGDHRLRADARRDLEQLLDGIAPVLTAVIRHSRKAARDMRRHGRLAVEYEQAALTGPGWIEDRAAPRYSTAASGLAEDYQTLTDEVLSAINAATQPTLS